MTTAPKIIDPFAYRDPVTGDPVDWCGKPLTSEQKSIMIKHAQDRWLAEMDKYHGVIHSMNDLVGFTVIGLTRYKPGIVRYFAVGNNCSRTGLANDNVFSSVQLPS